MKIILLLVLIGGCRGAGPFGIPIAGEGYDGPAPPQPGQDVAQMVVWNYTFSVPLEWGGPPPIVWRFNDSCTNESGTLLKQSFRSSTGICVDGEYDLDL